MYFIDDIDLAFQVCWGEVDLVPQLANVIDSAIGGAVNFDDIEGSVGHDGFAIGTLIAWLSVGRIKAIHCACENASDGRLSDSTFSREEVGMCNLLR